MRQELVRRIQEYVSITSIDITVLHGSPKGSVKAATEFCSHLDLAQFGIKRKSLFCKRLDIETDHLMAALPSWEPNWGTARKVLNIFLHNAFYNHYLRSHYGLSNAEPLYEVPIDSAVSKGLKAHAARGYLPTWNGVRHLTSNQNLEYQEFALLVAKKLQTS